MESDGRAQLALRAQLVPDFQRPQPRGLSKFVSDPAPYIPSAGVKHYADGQSVAQATSNQPKDNFAEMPLGEARWRSTFQRQPGVQMNAPGFVGAPLPASDYRHGVRTHMGSDRVGDVLSTAFTSDMGEFIHNQKEGVYASSRFEPLGTHYTRGHKLPESYYSDPNYRFGAKTSSSESAKSVMYAPNPNGTHSPRSIRAAAATGAAAGPADATAAGIDAQAAALDPQFVSDREVARQTNRQYRWPSGVDPAQTRFGHPAQNADLSASLGVTPCLSYGTTAAGEPTRIASLRPQMVANVWGSEVGRRRPLSDAIAKLGPDFVFGSRGPAVAVTAKDTIYGAYSGAEQRPDRDLGGSVLKSSPLYAEPQMLTTTAGGAAVVVPATGQAFGAPTVRTDRAEPSNRSLADDRNYGNEPTAGDLLAPSAYLPMGVSHSDFSRPRPASQVRQLIRAAALFPAVTEDEDAWAALVGQAAAHFPQSSAEPVFSVDVARQLAAQMTRPRAAYVSPADVMQAPRRPAVPETISQETLAQIPPEDKVRAIASRYRR
jgi:hypothetical protein